MRFCVHILAYIKLVVGYEGKGGKGILAVDKDGFLCLYEFDFDSAEDAKMKEIDKYEGYYTPRFDLPSNIVWLETYGSLSMAKIGSGDKGKKQLSEGKKTNAVQLVCRLLVRDVC